MPKRRPQNRRKKKSQPKLWSPPKDWSLPLWSLLGFNVLVGLFFSPITGVTTVRIVGAPAFEKPRLEKALQPLAGRPYFRVDKEQVRTTALQNPAVESAHYRANLFGRGVLELHYRKPVAKLGEGLYLSSNGFIYPWPIVEPVSVTVEPPESPNAKNLAAFGSWQSGTAARMCENMAQRLPDMDWRLVVSRTGFVSLVPAQGGRVEFGSFDDIDRKVRDLGVILHDDPKLLDRVRELNLSSTVPVYIP